MSPAAATPDTKQIVLNVTINFKRGKDELDYARQESERLYNLISTEEKSWAKDRIEKLQEFVLLGPDAESLKDRLQAKLEEIEE